MGRIAYEPSMMTMQRRIVRKFKPNGLRKINSPTRWKLFLMSNGVGVRPKKVGSLGSVTGATFSEEAREGTPPSHQRVRMQTSSERSNVEWFEWL